MKSARVLFSVIMPIFFLLGALFVLSSQEVKAIDKSGVTQGQAGSSLLHGEVSQNELIDNLETLGIKCILKEGVINTLMIEKVQIGSSAYYGGIHAGDMIKDLHKISANIFSLSIERSGKVYRTDLSLNLGKLDQDSMQTEIKNDLLRVSVTHENLFGESSKSQETISSGTQQTMLRGSLKDQETIKKLLPYDIELIIDITGSMNWYDGTGNLNKFQWCHNQVSTLAQKLRPYHKTFTITTFNTSHSTTENCDPAAVEEIYASIQPNGNTDLVDPLIDRLNRAYLKHSSNGHPVLIVVITDGLPNVPRNPRVVNRALVDFTQQMRDGDDIVVTILQIGDTFEGRDFCIDLDDNLVNEGAKYDIVDTKTFAELKREGLVNAMIDAAVEARENRHLSRQEKHLKRFVKSLPEISVNAQESDSKLKEKQAERKTIEQQLLGQ